MPTLELLRANWTAIQDALIASIDKDFGVYRRPRIQDEFTSSNCSSGWAFHGPVWRAESCASTTTRGARWRGPIQLSRRCVSCATPCPNLRLNDLTVGDDGRNRTPLWAFGSKTGRNQPSNSKFIFGPSVWLRGIDQAATGSCRGLHRLVLTGSRNRRRAIWRRGDDDRLSAPAIPTSLSGFAPASYRPAPPRRHIPKCATCSRRACSASSTAWAPKTLAFRIGQPEIVARDSGARPQGSLPQVLEMADGAVDCTMHGRPLSTVFGWHVRVPAVKPRKAGESPAAPAARC